MSRNGLITTVRTYTIQDAVGEETNSTTLTINIGVPPIPSNPADMATLEANAAA